MLDQRPNPFVMTDRAIAESGDDDAKGDYLQMVAELEATAHRVLAEQGLSHRAVSIQALVSDDLELSDRASKAMSVLISIRLLKLREQDAIRGGQATARTFYHVAQNAMIAAVVAALISPMMTDQDAEIAKESEDQSEEERRAPKTSPVVMIGLNLHSWPFGRAALVSKF